MKPAEVEKYISLLGCTRLRWASGKLHASCPFARWTHKNGTDTSPSFAVYRTSHGGLRYNCLACGEKGRIVSLLWRIRALTKELHFEAMMLVYDPYLERKKIPDARLDYRVGGASVGKATVRPLESYEPGSVEMPSGDTELLWEDMEVSGNVSQYHKPEEWEIDRYKVDPPEDVLERVGREAYDTWELGWDASRRRWMFPCRDRDGELVGYTGRLVWEQEHCFRCGRSIVDEERTAKKREDDPDAKAVYVRKCPFCGTKYTKYWHLPGEWRRRSLYGVHRYEKGRPVVVVEGSTDVIRLWEHGVRCPMGLFGNQVNPEQADLICSLEAPTVYVMGDGDKGGDLMNEELSAALEARGQPYEVVELPRGVDPGILSAQVVRRILEPAIQG